MMRNMLRLLAALVIISISGISSAETMQCFNGAIDDAGIDPPDRSEFARRCGEPDEKEGGIWVYHKSQFTYRVSFDNNGSLYLIERRHRE